jgi:hypothetical protein
MAIKNIPKITGPTFGGIIYGLSLESNYSEAPSKLKLNIVNERGNYTITDSSLFNLTNVEFGNFKFNGYIHSYSERTTEDERVLEVEIIDKSIDLDRYWVMLWKRGLLNQKGSKINVQKTFDFSKERVLGPQKNTDPFAPFIKFVVKTLPNVTLTRPSYGLTIPQKIGNVLLLGKEKFRDSNCQIADTDYNFTELLSAISLAGINIIGARDKNTNYRRTYEGTLRSVLSSWCSDFGMSFYWNYSTNVLSFYDIAAGISSIPMNLESSNIISRDIGSSIEGTFRQYGVGLTQKPRTPPSELTSDFSSVITQSNNPYPLSYFMSKKGYSQKITDESNTRWGAKRSLSSFITAAHCGFVSNALRDIYSFENSHWEVFGYERKSEIPANKKKIIGLLKQLGYDALTDYEELDAKDLPNFDFTFINYDATLHQKWRDIEQEMLQYLGRYYRIPDSTSNFFYCGDDQIIEVEVTTEPRQNRQEEQSEDFAGQYIYERGGSMSHNSEQAQNELSYESLLRQIQICAPVHIDLKESGLIDYLSPDILTERQRDSVNTLVIAPNSLKFIKNQIGFKASSFRGNSHPLEVSRIDMLNKQNSNKKVSCKSYEQNLEKKSCITAEEEAKRIAFKNAGLKGDDEENLESENFVEGLVNKACWISNISLKSRQLKLHSRCDGPYGSVTRYNFRAVKIFQEQDRELVYSEGSVGGAEKVVEIRVLVDDLTDSRFDEWGVKRKSDIPKASDVINITPQKNATYVFAGEPEGVTLSPQNGLSKLDISYSSEGFTTTAGFSTRPPNPPAQEVILRTVTSQLSRTSFNGG